MDLWQNRQDGGSSAWSAPGTLIRHHLALILADTLILALKNSKIFPFATQGESSWSGVSHTGQAYARHSSA